MGSQKKYYVVRKGRKPGIFTAWFGPGGAEEQVRGYAGAVYKGFATLEEAKSWQTGQPQSRPRAAGKRDGGERTDPSPVPGQIVIYTDGGCAGNPGPGGYGAVILDGGQRVELARGYRRTTNNRMELMACIAALDALKAPADVVLYSDSRYVVHGIEKGWARRWRANGWMRTAREKAENADLWAQLLALCERHRVRFVWVPGHAGNRENERCDQLATGAAQGHGLQEDVGYLRAAAPAEAGLPCESGAGAARGRETAGSEANRRG